MTCMCLPEAQHGHGDPPYSTKASNGTSLLPIAKIQIHVRKIGKEFLVEG